MPHPALTIFPADPRAPGASALLRQSHALMRALFPPEDNFFLDIDALCAPDIRFFEAKRGAETLGTGALAIRADHGEVKSMFVAEAARGQGVAAALLARIEAEAHALGLPCLRLETGNVLHDAHRLYARHGFAPRGPFGDYPDAPSSIFMEKSLGPSPATG
ncbi:MAG: GNAT family N-acetyltransferase [Roseovarius sp.]|nr:GNAT family N-acetyltransferase [Roseovarius sp.]